MATYKVKFSFSVGTELKRKMGSFLGINKNLEIINNNKAPKSIKFTRSSPKGIFVISKIQTIYSIN